ncbi:hypothetical protein SAMN04487920_1514 [Bacillus mycoides]|uniref:hypothetical protein n=1 Tax=Bacillus mycoides TaxID=1405 RepID=UPI0008EBBB5D|nr:hypothetical protein [Bacillus mycoides]SFQ92645.1 hypothetical protein SAMN04487920_1514 [Bacillus mycoides]
MTEQEAKRNYNKQWYQDNSEHRKKYMREYRAEQKQKIERLRKIEKLLRLQNIDIDSVI